MRVLVGTLLCKRAHILYASKVVCQIGCWMFLRLCWNHNSLLFIHETDDGCQEKLRRISPLVPPAHFKASIL
jgi:hypothetical protein